MAEQKTTQQYVREQYKVVENQAETVLRTWNDLAATTAALSFDTAEQSLRYKGAGQGRAAFQEATGVYRRMYEDGLKTLANLCPGRERNPHPRKPAEQIGMHEGSGHAASLVRLCGTISCTLLWWGCGAGNARPQRRYFVHDAGGAAASIVHR